MNNESFELRVDNLIAQITVEIKHESLSLWNSGAIDKKSYLNVDYTPVKACVYRAIEGLNIRPLSNEGKKILANLRHF